MKHFLINKKIKYKKHHLHHCITVFLSRDSTKKNVQFYFDRLDNTYTGFARSTRLFDPALQLTFKKNDIRKKRFFKTVKKY